jgi:hypothetical protein
VRGSGATVVVVAGVVVVEVVDCSGAVGEEVAVDVVDGVVVGGIVVVAVVSVVAGAGGEVVEDPVPPAHAPATRARVSSRMERRTPRRVSGRSQYVGSDSSDRA